MEIVVSFRFFPGFGARPRPGLKITARAQRRVAGGHLEEFVHTTVCDAPTPETWAQAFDEGLTKMQRLRSERELRRAVNECDDVLRMVETLVG